MISKSDYLEIVVPLQRERDKLQRQKDALVGAATDFMDSMKAFDSDVRISFRSGFALINLREATEEAKK